MNEKMITYDTKVERFWEKREKFLELNPVGTVPFLLASPNVMISGSTVMAEYFEDLFRDSPNPLIFGTPLEKAEIRRIVNWLDDRFFREVSELILYERVFNFFKSYAKPNNNLLDLARKNIHFHLSYLQFLLSSRNALAGREFSLADITAAAHLSSLDYLNEIPWEKYPSVKEWYLIIKSRPSFQPLLQDVVAGFKPPLHYKELDF